MEEEQKKNSLQRDEQLNWSSVVANNRMNRGRDLLGVNSYEKEIGFNIYHFLESKLKSGPNTVRWLDLCCGEGKALIETATLLTSNDVKGIDLEGIDLVNMFAAHAELPCLNFSVQSLSTWEPTHKYDLISCIHGLHYIGDKLQLIQKAIAALKPSGQFIGNIDLDNIKFTSEESMKRFLLKAFKENKVDYNSRKRMLSCSGTKNLQFNVAYKGANDKAGKNYTGQEVVDSYYESN